MTAVFFTALACPCAAESPTIVSAFLPLAYFTVSVVLLEWMLAQTLKIISSMCWNVLKSLAFAAFGTAYRFTVNRVQVLMLFKPVITKAFSFRANHFAFVALRVFPAEIKSVWIFWFVWKLRGVSLHEIEVLVFVNLDGHFYRRWVILLKVFEIILLIWHN